MSNDRQLRQESHGEYIAQAINGTAVVTVYQWAREQPADPQVIAAAQALFEQLPTNQIPAIAPLADGSRMPLLRNPRFVGRDAGLRTLAASLCNDEIAVIGQVAVATGLGGIGKTNLATEFVHRYGQFFAGGVFWLSFADPAAIDAQIAECGGAGGLQVQPDFHTLPLKDQAAVVYRAWQQSIPRLLVFDNCDSDDAEALVQQYRPTTGGCRILITSRRATWNDTPDAQPLPLGVLQRHASIALLRQFRSGLTDAEADTLAAELGDLPLALHLAGSYLHRYRQAVTPEQYLAQLRQPQLLEHRSLQGWKLQKATSPTQHEQHIARTFALSYERLDMADATDALALRLLARAACFAPGVPIQYALLIATLALDAHDPDAAIEARDALVRLLDLGLVEPDDARDVRLHRLLSVFVQSVVQDATAQEDVEQVMIAKAFELNTIGISTPLLALQPHLRHVTDAALPREDAQVAALCGNLGYYLKMIGEYAAARPYLECALAIYEQVLGPTHPHTARSLTNLGMLLHALGEHAAARSYLERALTICKQVFGDIHPDTATSLNNLGMLLESQGEYTAAHSYYTHALNIREQVLGPTHPDTATSLNNQGYLLESMGEYTAARSYYERALIVRERVLGPTHPDTASSLNNLGMLLYALGEHVAAQSYLERSLAIHEQALGLTHPHTALSLDNLGELLRAMGEYKSARPCFERALDIHHLVLGSTHPTTASSLTNLGGLLQDMGEHVAARLYYERALAIYEQVLGPTHPHTASSLNNLGGLLHELGEHAAARPYYERALAIKEQVLGPAHPATAQSLNNLGMLLYTMGKYKSSRPYLARALDIHEQVLGSTHPDTATSLTNLAGLCYAEQNIPEAAALIQRALSIFEQVLGPQHPSTQTARRHLVVIEATMQQAASNPSVQTREQQLADIIAQAQSCSKLDLCQPKPRRTRRPR